MIKQTIKQSFQAIWRWPKKYKIAAAILIIVVAIVVSWLLPRSIVFSYQQTSCRGGLTVMPSLYKSADSDDFRLVAGGEVKVAGIPVYATKTCVVPVAPPKQGKHTVKLAPFGWEFIAKLVTVEVQNPPTASVKSLQKEISAMRPLKLPLSAPDDVFSYAITVGDKKADCQTKGKELICDIKQLSLAQGTAYNMELGRYFADKKVATLAKESVVTLRAASVIDSSVKPGEVVYAKPTSIQIRLDKKLKEAKASLVKVTDSTREPIDVKTVIADDLVTISWEGELARSVNYELALDHVVARDESTLAAPYIMPFSMSGGPKVTGVSVGRIKVPLGSTIVLTFDQELQANQDIGKAISAGGGAVITGLKGNQVFINTANVPKCGTVPIAVNNSLLSNHGISGGSAWQYSTRMLCHSVGSIGTSVKGRAILAYYFGSGSQTVVYTGAIHGNESSTRSLMLRWIDELEANAQNIPADKTIIVIPAINPDGVASGTRTNANNVDLNRNFDVSDWKSDITTVTNAPFPGGGGSAPMSEPETRALGQLVARLRPSLVLSYHSIGGVVAGNLAGDSPSLAATYSSMSGYRNVTGVTSSVFEYQVTGTADDYFLEKLGVRSLLIELGSHSYHQFERNQKAMWAMLRL